MTWLRIDTAITTDPRVLDLDPLTRHEAIGFLVQALAIAPVFDEVLVITSGVADLVAGEDAGPLLDQLVRVGLLYQTPGLSGPSWRLDHDHGDPFVAPPIPRSA